MDYTTDNDVKADAVTCTGCSEFIQASSHDGCFPQPRRRQSPTVHPFSRKIAMQTYDSKRTIPGTPIFDGEAARRGYALNKMCFSFNSQANREEFLRDEAAYCRKFGLEEAQRQAVVNRDVLSLLREGGGVYFLGKLASGVLGLDMQDLGALQTGLSKEAFQQKLNESGK